MYYTFFSFSSGLQSVLFQLDNNHKQASTLIMELIEKVKVKLLKRTQTSTQHHKTKPISIFR